MRTVTRSVGRHGLEYYRSHFRESIQHDGAVCLECGKLRKTLGNHVRLKHNLTLDDYREKWGFNRQTVFVAASTAAKLRRLALKRDLGSQGSAELMAKARAARRARLPTRLESRLDNSEIKKKLYATGWQPRRRRKVSDGTLRRLARGPAADPGRIAAKAGVSVDTARRRLQALGLLPPRHTRWTVDRERILALRRQGLWPLEIARRMRIDPQLVRKTLWLLRGQGVGVPTPPRPRPSNRRRVTDDAFLTAFRRGGSPPTIATRLGVSKRYVIAKTHRLRLLGLVPPAARGPASSTRKETKPNATRRS